MSNNEKLAPSVAVLNELSISNSERQSEKERTEREKNVFAETLKSSIGEEMKSVLAVKKEEEKIPPKRNKIKEFFERLIRVCQ